MRRGREDFTCRTPLSNRRSETIGSARRRRISPASSARRRFWSRRRSSSRYGSGSTSIGWTQFDVYPFILLNLAFSTQAAYAAPLILLAQTRQADRDKANSIADAQHREELHQITEARRAQLQQQSGMLIEMMQQNTALTERVETLLKQNTELTETVRTLVERIDAMTTEVHTRVGAQPRAAERARGAAICRCTAIVCSSAAGETRNRPV